jgi:hypothetical protein
MGRILLLLILAFALGLTFPTSRAVIVEHSRPLLNPAYAWMTGQQMTQIVSDLELHQDSRGPLPLGRREFDEWLERRYPQESTRRDAWGTRFRLELIGDRFLVVSAGPDKEFGTDDDIVRQGEYLRVFRR